MPRTEDEMFAEIMGTRSPAHGAVRGRQAQKRKVLTEDEMFAGIMGAPVTTQVGYENPPEDPYVSMLSEARQQTPTVKPTPQGIAANQLATQQKLFEQVDPELGGARAIKEHRELTPEEWQRIGVARMRDKSYRGKVRAAIAGALQGATFGFGDEMAGAQDMKLGTLMTEPSKLGEEYRRGRDAMREINRAGQETNKVPYTVGEIGGGLATAAIPGMAPATIGKAIGVGAAAGATGALGSSEADLTKGEVGQAAIDTALGAGLGAGVGAAGGALVKGAKMAAGAVRRVVSPEAAAAQKVAEQAAKRSGELEAASQTGTRGSFYEQSMKLQDESSKMLGEQFRFRPGQAMGDPELALAEMKAANFPGTMSRAQQEEVKQLRQSAKLLDLYVDKVASDPAALGRSDVGNRVVKLLDAHSRKLIKQRSEAAQPFYNRYRELSGNAKLPTDSTIAALEQEIAGIGRGAGEAAAAPLKKSLEALKSGASLNDISAELSFWSSAGKSRGTVLDSLGDANKRRIARNVREALEADLDNAAETTETSEAVQALREGRRLWKLHSQAIENSATDTVKRMLKVKPDAGDTVTSKLLGASNDQIRGVFRVLNKENAEIASQLRAQMLDDVFTKAGKPQRGGSIATEEGVAKLSALQAKNALVKNESKLLAAFDGDLKAQFALRHSFQLLKRISFGPGIKGSTTAPQLAQVVKEAGEEAVGTAAGVAAGGGISGMAINRIARFIMGTLGNDKALNRVYSSPENIDRFNDGLQAILSGKTPSAYALRGIMALAETLGLQVGEQNQEQAK